MMENFYIQYNQFSIIDNKKAKSFIQQSLVGHLLLEHILTVKKTLIIMAMLHLMLQQLVYILILVIQMMIGHW